MRTPTYTLILEIMSGFMLCVVHTYGIFRIFDDWSLDFYLESDLLNPSLKLTSHTQVNVCQQQPALVLLRSSTSSVPTAAGWLS